MTPITRSGMVAPSRGVPFLTVAINSNNTEGGSAAVEALVAEGRYLEAANAARSAGDSIRATELFERIWEFTLASECAREAGDLQRALTNAIDAKNDVLIRDIAGELEGSGSDGKRKALAAFEERRRFAEAARLAEAIGELERAVELYRSAHLDLDAARLLEDLGQDREAGRVLERVLEINSGPSSAEATLRLGLLLARRLQHEPAVRHLQEAAKYPATKKLAQRALIVELMALGLREAARDILAAARRDDDTLPVDLDEYVRSRQIATAKTTQERDADVIAGRYRLEELLGSGAAGRVFRARDEVLGRAVAVKLLSAAHSRGQPAYQRFVREAKIASSLRHPNLVEVYDFSAELGYIVMEHMVGGSLAERLGEPMEQDRVRRFAMDLLSGLELAHRRAIIHRDVKPANIFFDARGIAKLGDFGVAHLLDLGQTQTGGLIGTLAYMAPEQITGARLSITADLYALGVTLFESLTGRLPFLGPDFVAEHLGKEPPLVRSIVPALAPGWDSVIATLLAKGPTQRYGTINELRHAMQGIDLGDTGPGVLVLPRATARPVEQVAAESAPAPVPLPKDDEEPRYQYETSIGKTAISTLSRAVDSSLNRSVIIERYEQGSLDSLTERRIYNLARGGGPYVQRSLAYDRSSRVAVYEAPAGVPLAELFAEQPAEPRVALRILKRLARGLAVVHEADCAHGALDEHRIVVDEAGNPTVLVCGLGPLAADPGPADDIHALVAVIARALRIEANAEALVTALTPSLSPPERSAIFALARPVSGEELWAFVDAIETALLLGAMRGS